MGTRGAIGRLWGDGFKGVYHHWDSYPEGLGKTLWDLYHDHFKHNVNAMTKYLIDEHPAGWSTICGKDFNKKPGYIEMSMKKEKDNYGENSGPECYCHGSRNEGPQEVTNFNAADVGCEYAYVFNNHNLMAVLSSYRQDGTKMIGAFGCGDPESNWRPIAIVDLEGDEPDWGSLDA